MKDGGFVVYAGETTKENRVRVIDEVGNSVGAWSTGKYKKVKMSLLVNACSSTTKLLRNGCVLMLQWLYSTTPLLNKLAFSLRNFFCQQDIIICSYLKLFIY